MPSPKKAQIAGEVLKYSLIGVVSVMILIAGYRIVNVVKDRACGTEIAKFEIDMSGIDKSLRFGEKEEQSHSVPCNVDRIYFFDLSGNANYDFLNESPLMLDAVKSGSKNIFLIKDGEVKSSFNAGSLKIGQPYYICLVPKFGNVHFSVEGGKAAAIESAIGQPECTIYPAVASYEEGENIINNAAELGGTSQCPNCPSDSDRNIEKQRIEETKKNVDVFHKFSVEGKNTKVEVILKPKQGKKLKDFKLYESIPGECVSDLVDYFEGSIKEGEYVKIKSDLLVMWKFSSIKESKTLSYNIKKLFNAHCRQLIKAIAVARDIEDED